ncbi:hypothetical protein WJX73_004329 [Symbiochloris irregularis]|uniref:CRAL-TRIO domain-containing protein n=1 Tax=Symbiochloris irregularis TaxID=706552 RepID=A0AAW1PJY4_9CHLO
MNNDSYGPAAQAERRQRYRSIFASTTSAALEQAQKRPGGLRGDKSRIIASVAGNQDQEDEQSSSEADEREEDKREADSQEQEADEQRKRKEKRPTARIVSYSDSESDDEHSGPFRSRRNKPDAIQDGLQNAQENLATNFQSGWPFSGLWEKTKSKKRRQKDSNVPRKQPRVQQLAALVTSQGAERVRTMRPSSALAFILRTGAMAALHRWQPHLALASEAAVLALSLPSALWRRKGLRDVPKALPRQLKPLYSAVAAFAAPTLIVQAALFLKKLQPHRRRRLRRSITESVRTLRAAQGQDSDDPASGLDASRRPQTGAAWATLYRVEIEEMKRVLAAQDVTLPAARFDPDNDAELMRFAIAGGILQAHSPEEKAVAIEEAVVRLMATLAWLRKHRFMAASQLRRWHHLVRWQGWDHEGRPLMLVRIARACDECQDGDMAETVADAVIAQVDRAVNEMLSDASGPDKVIVVIDARGASALQATRHVKLFKDVSVCLNQHYPARLHQLFLVELPAQLRWVLGAIKHLIYASTSARILTVHADDTRCPLPRAALDTGPMSPVASTDHLAPEDDGERRVSIPQLPIRTVPSLTPAQLLLRGKDPGTPHGAAARAALKPMWPPTEEDGSEADTEPSSGNSAAPTDEPDSAGQEQTAGTETADDSHDPADDVFKTASSTELRRALASVTSAPARLRQQEDSP